MKPDEARDDLEHLDDFEVGDVYDTARRALATLAAMETEADYRVVPHETVEGRYETVRYERIVSKWQEVPRE